MAALAPARCSVRPASARSFIKPTALLARVNGCAAPALRPATTAFAKPAALAPSQRMGLPMLPQKSSRGNLLRVSAAASGAAPPKPFKWGADMKSLAICIGLGVALSLCPPPAGVSVKAWNLLAIFTGTIVGIITTPLPLGAVAMLGLGTAMCTKVLTFAEAFSAFATEIP
jgi:hypothetical protein